MEGDGRRVASGHLLYMHLVPSTRPAGGSASAQLPPPHTRVRLPRPRGPPGSDNRKHQTDTRHLKGRLRNVHLAWSARRPRSLRGHKPTTDRPAPRAAAPEPGPSSQCQQPTGTCRKINAGRLPENPSLSFGRSLVLKKLLIKRENNCVFQKNSLEPDSPTPDRERDSLASRSQPRALRPPRRRRRRACASHQQDVPARGRGWDTAAAAGTEQVRRRKPKFRGRSGTGTCHPHPGRRLGRTSAPPLLPPPPQEKAKFQTGKILALYKVE